MTLTPHPYLAPLDTGHYGKLPAVGTAAPLSELTATVLLLHTVASQTAVTTPMTSGCCCPTSGSAATDLCETLYLPPTRQEHAHHHVASASCCSLALMQEAFK